MLGQSYRLWGAAVRDRELLIKAITYFEAYLTEYNSTAASWQIANIQYRLHNDYQMDTLDDAIEYYIKSVEFSDDKNGYSNTIERLTDIFSEFYTKKEYSDYKTFLEKLCFLRPNDLFFNYINIVGMLTDDVASDAVPITLERLLSIKAYKNCPKLLLTKAYLLYENQQSAVSEYMGIRDRAFEVYVSNPEFFVAEDIINLAWLYNLEGLHIKAYQLATDIEKLDTTEDIQSQALLLIAEAYLCVESNLTNVSDIKLYDNIKEETKNLVAKGKNETIVSLRLHVCEGILAYRLGMENALTGLSEHCNKLFGLDSINTTYLVAFLEYADGRFGECVEMCNQILEKFNPNDYSYHEVLFLKAEALMARASELSVGEALALYEEAETVLLTVKNAVEDDYILSLEKLHALYKAMPNRETELQEVTEKLFGIK